MKSILFVLALIFLSSCDSLIHEKNEEVLTRRIKLVEYTATKGLGHCIVEVDSIEYLSSTNGGVTPLIKPTPIKQEYTIELVNQEQVRIYSHSTGLTYTCKYDSINSIFLKDNL